jgi:orc1/cdc6 family replication initiation protein
MTDERDFYAIMKDSEEKYMDAEESNKLIKNKKVFSANYMPDTVYHRDAEIKKLTEHFIATRHQKYCSDLSIYGVTGSGKTLVTKMVFRTLAKGIQDSYYIFVSCNEHSTSQAIASYILSCISGNGKGWGVSNIIQQIKKVIEDKLLVLIFDEIDLFLKGNKANEQLIQIFSDWNNCVMVFISNDPAWHNLIKDHRTISRLHLTNMIFEPYEKYQIFDILKDRSKLGLVSDVTTDDDLLAIAEFSAQYSGDARVAIKLLAQTVSYAENTHKKRINFKILERAIHNLEDDNQMNFIESLPPQQLLILAAIYVVNSRMGKSDFDMIYSEYRKMLRDSKNWRVLSKNTIRVYIDELQTYGLIRKEIGKGRGRGKGREATSIFHTFDTVKFHDRVIKEMEM